MSKVLLVFPNQLYPKHPGLNHQLDEIWLLEDSLYFGDSYYPARFHKQKLFLHRATMKRYESELTALQGSIIRYFEFAQCRKGLVQFFQDQLKPGAVDTLLAIEPTDFILRKRIQKVVDQHALNIDWLENPNFLNSLEDNQEYRASKNRWFMADFYKWQRRRLNVLMSEGEPLGGRWSFDADNRKKVPKNVLVDVPQLETIERDLFDHEAVEYVDHNFSSSPGRIDQLYYPTSSQDAQKWLREFIWYRLESFGDYEDAIVEGESWLWHSVLTPMLNIGLLSPCDIINEIQDVVDDYDIPLNSTEGFIRQIIGWREFMRATYIDLGVKMRTTNHWKHHRKMPNAFWEGTTGVLPVDNVIHRILKTGYCHHIERLMVLGGFMFICEIDPDEIYRWFMELFVDSYDWVMVPNVYAMSQNSGGGLITTKPYFSGSSYIRKMSHYQKGQWCEIWDGLYWRWIWKHVNELGQNPRWAMMCSMAKKMDKTKLNQHFETAEQFLRQLR